MLAGCLLYNANCCYYGMISKNIHVPLLRTSWINLIVWTVFTVACHSHIMLQEEKPFFPLLNSALYTPAVKSTHKSVTVKRHFSA